MNGDNCNVGNFCTCVDSHIMLSMRPVLMLTFPVYFRIDPIKINEHIGPIQGKGVWCHIIWEMCMTMHLLMKEAPRTFKPATATWNKRMRIFCHLHELKGRFLISRHSSSYDPVHYSICGHWVTFTALCNYSLHIRSSKCHYTFLGADGRTYLRSLTPSMAMFNGFSILVGKES